MRLLLDTYIALWAVTGSRRLVAQARFEPMTLLTSDRLVGQYGPDITLV